MKLLIKGGKVVDFKNDSFAIRDILINDKDIEKISESIKEQADYEVINAKGLYVAPGFIDAHVHLREPGFEYKETISSGTKACAKGGFTHVFSMPNTNPSPDNIDRVQKINKLISESAVIKVTIVASVTQSIKGDKTTDMRTLSKENIIGFSDDGNPVNNDTYVRQCLINSKTTGKPLMTHSEDKSTFREGVINRGRISELYKFDGIPNEAEYNMIKRDIDILSESGGHLHICHVSTKESVELIREAKQNGLHITCEVTPHHLSLNEEMVLKKGTYAKVNPPLRRQEDVDAIVEGIMDGTVDMIATDHAPHEIESKETSLEKASYGFSGSEIAFSIAYTYLVKENRISLMNLFKLMSYNPSNVFDLDREGELKEGYFANIVLLDLSRNYYVDTEKFISKGKNSPFDGTLLNGVINRTIFEGKTVYKEGVWRN